MALEYVDNNYENDNDNISYISEDSVDNCDDNDRIDNCDDTDRDDNCDDNYRDDNGDDNYRDDNYEAEWSDPVSVVQTDWWCHWI